MDSSWARRANSPSRLFYLSFPDLHLIGRDLFQKATTILLLPYKPLCRATIPLPHRFISIHPLSKGWSLLRHHLVVQGPRMMMVPSHHLQPTISTGLPLSPTLRVQCPTWGITLCCLSYPWLELPTTVLVILHCPTWSC